MLAEKGPLVFPSKSSKDIIALPPMLAEKVAGCLPGARLAAVTRNGSSGAIYGVPLMPWAEILSFSPFHWETLTLGRVFQEVLIFLSLVTKGSLC
jgi:hypothetical protein